MAEVVHDLVPASLRSDARRALLVSAALRTLEDAFSRASAPGAVCLPFNGGKEATIVLRLAELLGYVMDGVSLFWAGCDAPRGAKEEAATDCAGARDFDEVHAFVEAQEARIGVKVARTTAGVREAVWGEFSGREA